MNEQEFEKRFGRLPEDDELERINCPVAGKPGHHQCEICETHSMPRIFCNCLKMEITT